MGTAAFVAAPQRTLETDIPARLDRLPWSRFHWLVLFALGITWVLDGLEVTLMGALSGTLKQRGTLGFSSDQIGLIGSCYVAGMVMGSLVFGYLTDRWGRRLLFFLTLAIYLGGTLFTAFSWNVASFALFRFITGTGIGGEYAAINSAIDELIPARRRGWVDLIVNGSYWLGAALGSLSTLVILDPRLFAVDLGWRMAFGGGAVVGLAILLLRNHVPESPRWLVLHGREREAKRIVEQIENDVEQATGQRLAGVEKKLKVHPDRNHGLASMARAMFTRYRQRSLLGLALMAAQAFLFNAIFFTYALVLDEFYHVPGEHTGLYLLPFALGSFLGAVVLGHFFDSWGRRRMICATYTISALLLALTGVLFQQQMLSAVSQTVLWTVIFFFASSAASAAYLTVSEIFPLETRGLAIAVFFSIGTAVGGVAAPWLFGSLIASGSATSLLWGYLLAAGLMLGAAVVEWFWGVDAERKSLEEIALPLASDEAA
ncbi:MAG TPA: MFS transporter [Pirellulales bacterium]|nr:MFS transporter [Pirellulales bacterium]